MIRLPGRLGRLFAALLMMALLPVSGHGEINGEGASREGASREGALGAHPLRIATYEQSVTLLLYQRFIREAYLRLDIPVHYSIMPPLRAVQAVDLGTQDAILMASTEAEPSASNLLRVSEPLPGLDFHMLVRDTMPGQTLPHDLGPYTVGYLRGIHPLERVFADKAEKLTINSDFETLVELLILKRIDVVALPEIDARLMALRHPELKVLRRPVYRFHLFHYVHKDHEEIAAALSAAFRELKHDELCMARFRQVVLGSDINLSQEQRLARLNSGNYTPLCDRNGD